MDNRVQGTLSWDTAPDVLTINEAAMLLRVPRNAAYEAVRLGLLPAVNLGQRRLRVSKAVLRQVFGGPGADCNRTAALSHGKA